MHHKFVMFGLRVVASLRLDPEDIQRLEDTRVLHRVDKELDPGLHGYKYRLYNETFGHYRNYYFIVHSSDHADNNAHQPAFEWRKSPYYNEAGINLGSKRVGFEEVFDSACEYGKEELLFLLDIFGSK